MKKWLSVLCTLLLLLTAFPAFAQETADSSPAELSDGQSRQKKQPVTSLAMLDQPGIKIAVGLDTPAEKMLARDFPQAKVIPYIDLVLAYMDVVNGRVDACVNARKEMELAIQNDFSGVRLLDEDYFSTKVAVGISPVSQIPDLKEKLNTFIAEVKKDGTLDDMYDRWVNRNEQTMPDIPPAENPSLTLRVGTTGNVAPYSYYAGTELVGYDIELAHRFAGWLGAKLVFKVYDFGGIIAAAEGGSIDCIMSNLYYTDEKNEAIPFSDVLFEVPIAVMVQDDGQGAAGVPETGFTSLSQLDGARIGVPAGTIFDGIIAEQLPGAQIGHFDNYHDLAAALEAKKIDGFPGDEPVLRLMAAEDPRLSILDERMDSFDIGFVLPRTEAGEALQAELNAWITSMRESGELQKIIRKWTEDQEDDRTIPDYASFPAPKGTLRMATLGDYAPLNFSREGEAAGMEIDLAARFCEANGYGLIVETMDFDGILPAVQTGRVDFAAAGVCITDERMKSVNFSMPYYSDGIVMAVLKAEPTPAAASSAASSTAAPDQGESFWDSLAASFNKTFIRENRWRLFVKGVGTTVLITVLSILFGTLLGFVVFMLCRNGNPVANGVTRFSIWLVTGTPMVVLLMILYYIIFGSLPINGIVVAVIGFSLTFGSAVFNLLRLGVGAIDRGQYEAAYALGHDNKATFFRIILPQAIPLVLPSYQGEIVGLIKATAIVGYIAVQDLAKMGDIVRSRTYEAFFPLIAITVIYFVLEGLFNLIINHIRDRIDPRKRSHSRVLKGVDLHD